MSPKKVLIVDDEETILSVLKSSLRKLGAEYEVVTAANGSLALECLHQQTFDLVVTDYRMAGMNGLELLEIIRQIQPDARVILMTAYGSRAIEEEARRMKAFRYLTKPLEIKAFREIVKEALVVDESTRAGGILVLNEEYYRKINQTLVKLQTDIGARCVFLTDAEGRFIARVGNVENLPLEQIATLVGGAVATLLEAGRVIDGDAETVNLAYREGKRENLYVVNIGRDLLLIIITEHGPYASRLGTVWFYAQQIAVGLRDLLKAINSSGIQQMLGNDLAQAIGSELDNLFSDGDFSSDLPNKTVKAASAGSVKACAPPAAPAPGAHVPVIEDRYMDETIKLELLSFDDAISKGLIDQNQIDGQDPHTFGGS